MAELRHPSARVPDLSLGRLLDCRPRDLSRFLPNRSFVHRRTVARIRRISLEAGARLAGPCGDGAVLVRPYHDGARLRDAQRERLRELSDAFVCRTHYGAARQAGRLVGVGIHGDGARDFDASRWDVPDRDVRASCCVAVMAACRLAPDRSVPDSLPAAAGCDEYL